MSEQENVHAVQRLFEAFGRGDLPGVLGLLAEDVDWQSPATRTEHTEISWSRPRRGREQVAQFFKELAEKMQPEPLEPLDCTITAQDNRVILEGRNRGRVRSTGRSYEHDWVMAFTLREGKIVRYRHYYDTADIVSALRGK